MTRGGIVVTLLDGKILKHALSLLLIEGILCMNIWMVLG